jgi:hypothetical protein
MLISCFSPEDGGDVFLRNQLDLNGLHDVLSQKIELLNLLLQHCLKVMCKTRENAPIAAVWLLVSMLKHNRSEMVAVLGPFEALPYYILYSYIVSMLRIPGNPSTYLGLRDEICSLKSFVIFIGLSVKSAVK